MTFDELYQYLLSHGYGELVTCPSPDRISLLDHNLERTDEGFQIVDRERADISQIWLTTQNEDEACAAYLTGLEGRFLHLVAFDVEATVLDCQSKLTLNAISHYRNDVPGFSGPGTTRFRIFVKGRDLKRSLELIAANIEVKQT
jgi:hypothetical protein